MHKLERWNNGMTEFVLWTVNILNEIFPRVTWHVHSMYIRRKTTSTWKKTWIWRLFFNSSLWGIFGLPTREQVQPYPFRTVIGNLIRAVCSTFSTFIDKSSHTANVSSTLVLYSNDDKQKGTICVRIWRAVQFIDLDISPNDHRRCRPDSADSAVCIWKEVENALATDYSVAIGSIEYFEFHNQWETDCRYKTNGFRCFHLLMIPCVIGSETRALYFFHYFEIRVSKQW